MDQFKKWDAVIVKSWDKEYKWIVHTLRDINIYWYTYVVIIEVWQYMSAWHVNWDKLTLQNNE